MPILLKDFLRAKGFHEHPFSTTSAEREQAFLSSFFVRPEVFDWLLGQPGNPESKLLFAPVGFGKTSQRLELARELREGRHPALVITLDDFSSLLSNPAQPVTLGSYLSLIRRQTIESLAIALESQPQRAEQLERHPRAAARLYAMLAHFTPWRPLARPAPPGVPEQSLLINEPSLGFKEWLRMIAGIVHAAGFSSVFCLLDGLDELQETRNQPERLFALLSPLLDAPGLLDDCGFTFRFFLPQYLEGPMQLRGIGRLDRIPSRTLVWSDAELVAILQQRLRSFSRVAASASFSRVTSFADLCNIPLDVDQLLVERSGHAPRQMLTLARMVFEEHCALATSVAEPIDQSALEAALARFDTLWRAAQVGAPTSPPTPVHTPPPAAAPPAESRPAPSDTPLLRLDSRGNVWIGDRLLNVALGGTARRCLEILWNNRTRMLRYDELIAALYGPNWDQRGDAQASLEKLIQRLRKTLDTNNEAAHTYIKTVKGTGYRLENWCSD